MSCLPNPSSKASTKALTHHQSNSESFILVTKQPFYEESLPFRRDIQQWMSIRDDTSHSVAKQSASLLQVLDQMTEVESETLSVSRKNRDLAAELLSLLREADRDRMDAIADDPVAEAQIVKLERRLAASKQKWKIMKGTASGIVAGSGVAWARDAELRDIVLDPD